MQRHRGKYTKSEFPITANADIIVVIPCFNEPDILHTLQNIKDCRRTDANILISIIINSGVDVKNNILSQNRLTFSEVERFARRNNELGLMFLPLIFEEFPKKHAGVGLARKVGMDLAIDYFYSNKKKGIIISLDADCEVSENFFVSINAAFKEDEKLNCTIQNFHHRVENNNIDIENAIRQYESYLHYFSKMLKHIGFPYYYHTIGSAFAVSADAYVRVGGMGRQQGGEDFYFLQKVFQIGCIKELEDTYVYPMARFSDRVPFGTGPALQKILEDKDGVMKVYSKESFYCLKLLFDIKDQFYKKEISGIIPCLTDLNPALQSFLEESNFLDNLNDCNNNSSNLKSFSKRFFHHFNTFRIIKYLNSVHPSPFSYKNIYEVNSKM